MRDALFPPPPSSLYWISALMVFLLMEEGVNTLAKQFPNKPKPTTLKITTTTTLPPFTPVPIQEDSDVIGFWHEYLGDNETGTGSSTPQSRPVVNHYVYTTPTPPPSYQDLGKNSNNTNQGPRDYKGLMRSFIRPPNNVTPIVTIEKTKGPSLQWIDNTNKEQAKYPGVLYTSTLRKQRAQGSVGSAIKGRAMSWFGLGPTTTTTEDPYYIGANDYPPYIVRKKKNKTNKNVPSGRGIMDRNLKTKLDDDIDEDYDESTINHEHHHKHHHHKHGRHHRHHHYRESLE